MNEQTQQPDSSDQIYILLPNKTVRNVPITAEQMTIGRDLSCDIVLDHPSISRQHARIEYDGKAYRVRDLGSTNGTYLGNVRLLPEVPTLWTPDENLRVGEIWMRLERVEQTSPTLPPQPVAAAAEPPPSPPVEPESEAPTRRATLRPPRPDEVFTRPDGSRLDPAQITFSPDEGQIGLYTDTPAFTLIPGNPTPITILVFNRRPTKEVLRLTLQGVPPSWLSSPPAPVTVPPKGVSAVVLQFKPPRSPQSKAGRHKITVRLSSSSQPSQVAEISLTITMAAFSQFSSELLTKSIRSGEVGRLVIHNQGNLPESFTITLDDPAGELAFEPQEIKLTVPAGQSGQVEYRAGLAYTRWSGGELSHSYKAVVASQAGQLQSHSGIVTSRGIIPSWGPAALGVLALIAACLACLLIYQLGAPRRNAQSTEVARQTAIALIVQQTSQAGTATAQATQQLAQGTATALTATASWRNLDSDQDGLANGQELQLGTKPDQPDTDGDGLTDGDEVMRYQTNPLLADTDGDSLKDGEEVRRNLNPLKRDTDGDGIDDNLDPDPLSAASPTPPASATATFTPSPTVATVTPTRTVTPTSTATQPTTLDLTISLSNGASTSVPGTNTTYTLVVTNKGPAAANDIQVTDTFPTALTNITWTCIASAGSACQTASGSGNISTKVNLVLNGTATFTINATIRATATGPLVNSATVTPPAGLTELNNVDNLAIDTDTLSPQFTLTFSKSDGLTSASPGQNITYTLIATNAGPSALIGATINDTLPEALTNAVWSCSASAGSSCSAVGVQSGNVNTAVDLLPGGSATITINAQIKATASGTLINTAYLNSPVNPAANNKTATDTTTLVPLADLSVQVVAPTSVISSTIFTYTITITNNGPSTATNVTLTDYLPGGVTFISSSPGAAVCTHGSGTVICNLGNLASGGTITVQIVVKAPNTEEALTNQANITASEGDPQPSNNTVSTVVQVT